MAYVSYRRHVINFEGLHKSDLLGAHYIQQGLQCFSSGHLRSDLTRNYTWWPFLVTKKKYTVLLSLYYLYPKGINILLNGPPQIAYNRVDVSKALLFQAISMCHVL